MTRPCRSEIPGRQTAVCGRASTSEQQGGFDGRRARPSDRSERVVFREINERIEGLATTFEVRDALDLICECADATCTSRIQMSREDYEKLRSDATTFAVVSGHEIPDIEEIVARHKTYEVVRKTEATHRKWPRRPTRAKRPPPGFHCIAAFVETKGALRWRATIWRLAVVPKQVVQS